MKPSNILLDHDGEPHVADFSLAKRLDHEGDLTHTGEVLGTPAFMAPEVAFHGGAEAGVPSDIYSLGAMLYQLITGRPPHHGGTTLETIRHTADEEVKVPSTLNASVNRDLSTVALKCLERDPARRYVTALEIAEDLQRFIRDEPIRARHHSGRAPATLEPASSDARRGGFHFLVAARGRRNGGHLAMASCSAREQFPHAIQPAAEF